MPGPTRKSLLVAAAAAAFALSLAGSAGCARSVRADSDPEAVRSTEAPREEKAPAAKTGSPLDVAGMDFSSLPPPAQRELAAVFTDEFCYCGCPHTLGACLTEHTECRHAKRMAKLAAGIAATGMPSNEIIVLLSRYYLSFGERVDVPVDPRMCQGPDDAPVTVVEFSDFECPYCALAVPVLDAVAKEQGEKVRLCHLPFPLPGHPNALPAAQAVLFARDHGKFEQMHHALFEQKAQLSQAKILELGEKVGLPRAELAKALETGAYTEEIQKSRELGRKVGVDGTPSVFVNGRRYPLGFAPEPLRHTIEDELEWQAHDGWAKD